MMKVKVNVSSSSLVSFSMKFGFDAAEEGSGSYIGYQYRQSAF